MQTGNAANHRSKDFFAELIPQREWQHLQHLPVRFLFDSYTAQDPGMSSSSIQDAQRSFGQPANRVRVGMCQWMSQSMSFLLARPADETPNTT
eukprot:5771749-Amphidinium_carterae.1